MGEICRRKKETEYQKQELGRQAAARYVGVPAGEARQTAVLKYQYQEKCFELLSFHCCELVNKYH